MLTVKKFGEKIVRNCWISDKVNEITMGKIMCNDNVTYYNLTKHKNKNHHHIICFFNCD